MGECWYRTAANEDECLTKGIRQREAMGEKDEHVQAGLLELRSQWGKLGIREILANVMFVNNMTRCGRMAQFFLKGRRDPGFIWNLMEFGEV
jgi:hypothetical protein